jgi:hypothetical protein
METCRLCKQPFPDRKALDRHPCPMAGESGPGRVGLRFILAALLILAGVSAGTWLFVTRQWAAAVLEVFDPAVNPTHVHIANGAASFVFAATWWRYLRIRGAWKKLALVLLALLIWAGSMPAVRAALF